MNDMLVGADPGTAVTMEDPLPPEVGFIEGTLTGQAIYQAASATVRWAGQLPRCQDWGAVGCKVPVADRLRSAIFIHTKAPATPGGGF